MEDDVIACPKCGSQTVVKFGISVTRAGRVQRYQCSDCGRIFNSPSKREEQEPVKNNGFVCPNCGLQTLVKKGFKVLSTGKVQRYQCKSCAHICTEDKLQQ